MCKIHRDGKMQLHNNAIEVLCSAGEGQDSFYARCLNRVELGISFGIKFQVIYKTLNRLGTLMEASP